jgi:hypothetical protein
MRCMISVEREGWAVVVGEILLGPGVHRLQRDHPRPLQIQVGGHMIARLEGGAYAGDA